MNVTQWRSGLQSWLSTFLLVDSWELRNPTQYGTINAFISPLQAVSFLSEGVDRCTANQDLYLTSRYSGDTLYKDLPLGTLEQLYTTISRRFVLTWGDIAPILDLQIVPVTNCITVEEYGDDPGDWLVTLIFSLQITWQPTITPLPGDGALPVVDIRQINNGLFRQLISSNDPLDPNTRDKFGQTIIER